MLTTSKIAFVLAALALPATPAIAQAITVGMQVTDTTGAPVGTVTGIQGDNVLVKTDKYTAALAKTSFTPSKGKLLYAISQAQLDAEIEKSLAAADASVKAGASVKGSGGSVVGTIEAADAEMVTIDVGGDANKKLKLPRSGVRGNPDGTVTIGLSAEEVQAELNKAASSASASDSASTGK